MKRGEAYAPEMKASVIAAVGSGDSITATSKRFGVARSTIQKWAAEAQIGVVRTTAVQQKKQELGEQVYGLIEDSIQTLRAQLRVAGDETWLKRQSAGDVAILHGVIADKTIRLLASLRPNESDVDG